MKIKVFQIVLVVMIYLVICVSCSFQSDSFNKTVSIKDISKDMIFAALDELNFTEED